jgi:threonine/homoserine/homoserine lactone efflux protein
MAANQDGSAAGQPARSWRTADVGAPVLLGGLLLVAAAVLGLASLGSAAGIAAVAVVLLGVIGLLWFWGREQLRGAAIPPGPTQSTPTQPTPTQPTTD